MLVHDRVPKTSGHMRRAVCIGTYLILIAMNLYALVCPLLKRYKQSQDMF
jgi:hypothetical protein